ncbi:MAG: hypothetical protein ACPGSV_03660 [Candidatus Poseidoniaceae archaeon]
MRSAVLFVSLLLLSCIPLTDNVSAIDEDSGLGISVTFDGQTEVASVVITAPETTNVTLLDELKNTNLAVLRVYTSLAYNQLGEITWLPELIETVETGIRVCEASDLNSECSQSHIQIEHYPIASNYSLFEYWLIEESDLGTSLTSLMGSSSILAYSRNVSQTISPPVAVENLTAEYTDGVTTLSWDYTDNTAMNHSIMVYSHTEPATRESWDSMSKMIVSSSVSAGSTSYQINHSGSSVEREIYYSVTLLFENSEDTRFLGSNTLEQPIFEDNVAPLFIGELTATFDPISDTTTIDWGVGVDDDDLVINIYRSDKEFAMVDSTTFVDSVDASISTTVIQVPDGEHRQSWYAITLQDSTGNEILELTEASPVSQPVIESTIDITTVTNLGVERYGDGTIVITWDDETGNPEAVARVWRSFTGPITSLQNVEELVSVNLSNEQASHNPLNPQDEAWYAVTIDATWGSGQEVWHDETLVLGLNSLSNPIRETDEVVEAVEITFNAQVISSSGIRANITDGAMISLGQMDQNDILVISTSYPVENISCYGIAGDNTSIHAEMDWALTFNANQSGEVCGGLISDGNQEITFVLSWNYVETVYESNNSQNTAHDEDDDDDHDGRGSKGKGSSDVAAITILSILILSLLIYLAVMMKKQDYSEEE